MTTGDTGTARWPLSRPGTGPALGWLQEYGDSEHPRRCSHAGPQQTSHGEAPSGSWESVCPQSGQESPCVPATLAGGSACNTPVAPLGGKALSRWGWNFRFPSPSIGGHSRKGDAGREHTAVAVRGPVLKVLPWLPSSLRVKATCSICPLAPRPLLPQPLLVPTVATQAPAVS